MLQESENGPAVIMKNKWECSFILLSESAQSGKSCTT